MSGGKRSTVAPDGSCTRPGCAGHTPGKCVAHTRSGLPCGRWPTSGAKVCNAHGARSPRVRNAAHNRLAEQRVQRDVATLGLPVEISPKDALLHEVYRTAGAVQWLDIEIRALDPAALTWSRSSSVSGSQAIGRVNFTEYRADVHALVKLWWNERDRMIAATKAAIAAGINERLVDEYERLGGVLADSITALVDDLGLSPEQRQNALMKILPAHLTLLAGGLGERSAS